SVSHLLLVRHGALTLFAIVTIWLFVTVLGVEGPADHRALRSFPTRRSSDLAPGDRGLVGVGRADHVQARDGAQRGEVLDRLVGRSEEHTSELQSRSDLVCRLLLEKKKYVRLSTRKPRPD